MRMPRWNGFARMIGICHDWSDPQREKEIISCRTREHGEKEKEANERAARMQRCSQIMSDYYRVAALILAVVWLGNSVNA